MGRIFGYTLAILAVLGAGYAWLNSGTDYFATRRDATQAINRAQIADVTYNNANVSRTMKGYITVLQRELAKDDAHIDEPLVKKIIVEIDKAIQDLQAHPPRRSAVPDALPLGLPPPPPLGPTGSGVNPPPPSIGRVTPPGLDPAPAVSSNCSMDAYARANLQHWCRARAEPKPEACRCLN